MLPHSDDKIRIAYLIDTIERDTTGTEKQLLEVIRRLDRRRYEPRLVCLRESHWMRDNELPCDVNVLGYNGFLKKDIARVVGRLSRFIDAWNITVLQTFFVESIFIGYLSSFLTKHRPVMLASRRDMGLGNEPSYHKYFNLLLPFVNRRFDGIVANGNKVMSHVMEKEHVRAGNIRVIYNGVAMPNGARSTPDIFRGTPGNTLWIGIAASLTPVKRIDVFLKAMELLMSRNGAARFKAVILGDGPEKERLRQLADRSGLGSCVHFQGSVKNVTDYLLNLDIAVLCSDKEGFSNAILESMACRLPIVATAVGGNTELVDEENGICIPPGDPEALANALETLAADRTLRDRMGAASFEKILTRYSWERSIGELEAYYEELVRSRTG
jgi:glycosyltransferase involved in cell wall biosynthesis